MVVAVFILLTAAYLAFGTERAFEPGSYKTSLAWCLTSLLLGIPAALLRGWVCARIAVSPKAVASLVVVVAILGLLVAVPTFSSPPVVEARGANVPNLEAMTKAKTPPWVALLNVVVGVGGVLIGGRRNPC
jgi:peptidoglycan/LPS O-acetylase OafA/YrhL